MVLAFAIAISIGCQAALAEAFGIKFLGNSATTVNACAGVVYIPGWTNIATASFTSGIIWSSDGSVSATLTRSGPGKANLWHSGAAGDGGNGSLLDGYNDCQRNSPSTNVISGLKGTNYTVYIYTAGDTARPSNNGDWLPNYTVNGTEYCTATVDGNGAFLGLIKGGVTTTNINTYPPALTYGNYLEIGNVVPVAGAITMVANADNRTWRSPLNGIEIVANTKAPLIQIQPVAQMVDTNGVAQFAVVMQGTSPMSYSWRKNGVGLNEGGNVYGSKANSLTITNLALTDAGDYAVVVTNGFGSVTSQVAHLSVVVPVLADLEIDAYNKAYLVQTNGLTYYAQGLTNRAADSGWTFSIDIEGEEDAYERTQSPQHLQLINSLCTTWLIQNPPPWSGDGWNDDLGWFSLALVRGYQMTGNANFLAQAEYGFNLAFTRGWDTNFDGGGIWEEQPASVSGAPNKNPLANDSVLQTACMIYQSTSNAVYLAQAEQIYSWVRTNLFNPNTGQVYGDIATNGVVDTSSQLYNQGTFVDCANLLHNITGQPVYYSDALAAVEYARNTASLSVNGIFNNGATYIDTWAAEFARGLGHFVKDNNLWSTYYPWMLANANAAWACRRPDYNVSWNEWSEPTPTTNDLSVGWAVSAVAMAQATPASEPGFVNCTNKLSGTIIGTSGAWSNDGNTIAKVFDGNLATFFDGPDASGDWAGLDFGAGASNVIGQINYWPRTGFSLRMLGGIFQAANNSAFTNPVALFTIATAPPEGGVVTSQTITNANAFRYVRYVGPANGYCNVAELQFFSPNPLPTFLTNSWNGSQWKLNWPNGGLLLEATNITGPWITNASASPPFLITPNQPRKFYRILAP